MASDQKFIYRLLRGDLAIIFYMSLLRLLLHLVVNLCCAYGYFRDELYYLACSDHLAAGYVDQPALSIFILKFNTLIFGNSLVAVRFLPALSGAATVFVTGLITIEIGGKKFAQFLACLCSFSLITLAMNAYYSMNSFDILFWTLATYVLLLIIKGNRPGYWILLGVILGLGLSNKIGVLFLGAGLFTGLLLTEQRRWFKTKWPYITGVIALTLFVPYVVWNVLNNWAHLEFIHNASAGKYASLTPSRFLLDQFLMNNPVSSLVWLAGLGGFLFLSTLKPFRLLAFLYLVPLLIFLVNRTSKAEYLSPAYSILWAAGGITWERLTTGERFGKFVRASLCSVIILSVVLLMPLVLPVLPVEQYISYSQKLGIKPESNENKELSELPQFYADMFGWKEKAEAVAIAYNTLTPQEKSICAIYSDNYGRCGAIDLFGKDLGLPQAIGSHNNYWIWGPRNATGELVIVLGSSKQNLEKNFESVQEITVSSCRYCMPYENNVPVFVCRNIRIPLQKAWPLIKVFV